MQHPNKVGADRNDPGYRLKSFFIDKSFANALSSNLKSINNLNSLVLSRNALSDEAFIKIIDNLPQKVRRLDVSNNKALTIQSYTLIKSALRDPFRQIEFLNLECNLMGDDCCRQVCEGILESYSLKVLNLSMNKITDVGALCLSKMLMCNDTLESLLLHWNQIRGKGASLLAKALKRNQTLCVFDASFNSFGSCQLEPVKQPVKPLKSEKSPASKQRFKKQKPAIKLPQFEEFTLSAYKWSKALRNNKSLVHIDLSFNSFKYQDVFIMGEALKENHTILGIHMMGNEGKVDERGFLLPDKEHQDIATSHVFTRIPALLKQAHVNKSNLLGLNICSNCWLCEGWTQIKFVVQSHKDTPSLHLSFEEFNPNQMDLQTDSECTYLIYKMVPPGKHTFFYSNGDSNTFIDANQQSMLNKETLILNQHVTLNVPKLNYIENIQQSQQILSAEDFQAIKAQPRPGAQKNREQEERSDSVWSLKQSAFAHYKIDTEQHLVKCFTFDWACSKLDKIIKSVPDKEKTFNFLNKNYRCIRETYKYYSSLAPSGNVFSIGTNVFSDIILNCQGLLDNRYLRQSDLDLEFISTKAGNQYKDKNNPERQLIRYQFMEVFVRLAIAKYYKSKVCDTIYEAVVKAFQESVLPFFQKFNSNDFKNDKLWTQSCDQAIKTNLKSFQDIYFRFSGKETLPGEQRFMSMNEFIDLVTLSGVIDDSFGTREVCCFYNLSMMTQVDEISQDRHLQMSFIEFVEAFSRVVDRLKINQPEPYQPKSNGTGNEEERLTQEYPLHKKIVDYVNKISCLEIGEEHIQQFQKKSSFRLRRQKSSIKDSFNNSAGQSSRDPLSRINTPLYSINQTPSTNRNSSYQRRPQ